jgi:hypothetical protein
MLSILDNKAKDLSLNPSVNLSKKSLRKEEFNIMKLIKACRAIKTNLMCLSEAKHNIKYLLQASKPENLKCNTNRYPITN